MEDKEDINKRNWSLKSETRLQQQSSSVRIKESRKQIIKMLLVIILAFSVCWCPRYITENCTDISLKLLSKIRKCQYLSFLALPGAEEVALCVCMCVSVTLRNYSLNLHAVSQQCLSSLLAVSQQSQSFGLILLRLLMLFSSLSALSQHSLSSLLLSAF